MPDIIAELMDRVDHGPPALVPLRNGLSISADALDLALRLERSGVTLRAEGDDLVALPPDRISADDRRLLAIHWREVHRLCRYCDSEEWRQ